MKDTKHLLPICRDTYYWLYGKYNGQLQALKDEMQEQRGENEECAKCLKSGVNMLKDLVGIYQRADILYQTAFKMKDYWKM